MNIPRLYIDLDGVLVDFITGFKNRTGKSIFDINDKTGGRDLNILLKYLKGDKDYWANLGWTQNGKVFWSMIKYFDPIILTTALDDKACRLGKLEWVRKHLGYNVPVIFEKDKSKYADENALLVDDFGDNIVDWITAGGEKGFLYTDAKSLGIVDLLYSEFEEFILPTENYEFENSKFLSDPSKPTKAYTNYTNLDSMSLSI